MKKTFCIIFALVLIIPLVTFGQNAEHEGSSNDKLISAAREIMLAAGTCALITLDENDLPRVRAMDPFPPESDFTVWFGTNPNSRKVNQINKNPNVTLYYLDSDASGYVVIHGMAELVNDKQEKEKHWKVEWDAFYPNKTDDYVLVKVSPKWMELISNTRGIVGDTKTWETPRVFFNDLK